VETVNLTVLEAVLQSKPPLFASYLILSVLADSNAAVSEIGAVKTANLMALEAVLQSTLSCSPPIPPFPPIREKGGGYDGFPKERLS
jgi:hypothetical protein